MTVVPALRGRGRDPRDVFQRGLLAVLGQPEADRGGLDRHLGAAARGQAGLGQLAEQPHVLIRDRRGLVRVGRVLAEEVDRDQQAVGEEPLADGQRIGGGLARHEPGDHVAGDRRGHDQVTILAAGRQGQERSAQHGGDLQGTTLSWRQVTRDRGRSGRRARA